MRPLLVTAALRSPVATGNPLMLDGILYAGVGRRAGDTADGGWASPREVYGQPLPLAKVELPDGRWWWAASQASPRGPEALTHSHRRPPTMEAARWTSARSINRATGPDKALRAAVYYRPQWMRITWSAFGDPEAVRGLLAWVPAVGPRTSQGWGWVDYWQVAGGGPPLDAYRTHVGLRHLPADHAERLGDELVLPERCTLREMPLTPPYYGRARSVRVWQAR